MKALVHFGLGLAMLWLQVTLAPLIEIGGIKPDLLLISVLVMGVYWLEPWVFLYAAGCGLALDVFSHGVLGIYALSFFGVSFLARYVGATLYENNLLFGSLAVMGLSVVEGLISATLFHILDPNIPWWRWMFLQTLPESLYNGLLAPVIFLLFARMDRWSFITDN